MFKEIETRDHGFVFVNPSHVVAIKETEYGTEVHLSTPLYGKLSYFICEVEFMSIVEIFTDTE